MEGWEQRLLCTWLQSLKDQRSWVSGFCGSNAKKGWRVLYASLNFTTWCNYQPREQWCIPNSCHHLRSTFFLDEEWELDTKKNRSNRLIAQVYQVCTVVVMCTRGSWESHHLDIAVSAVLGIHKHPQDQLIPKIDCFKLKQALTVIPWTVNSTLYSLYLWRRQSVFFGFFCIPQTLQDFSYYTYHSCKCQLSNSFLHCLSSSELCLNHGCPLFHWKSPGKTLGNFTKWSKRVSGGLGQRIILWKFTRHKSPGKLHIMFSETYY